MYIAQPTASLSRAVKALRSGTPTPTCTNGLLGTPQPPTRHHAVHSLSHAQQQASRLCAHAGSDASAPIGKVANTHVGISWVPHKDRAAKLVNVNPAVWKPYAPRSCHTCVQYMPIPNAQQVRGGKQQYRRRSWRNTFRAFATTHLPANSPPAPRPPHGPASKTTWPNRPAVPGHTSCACQQTTHSLHPPPVPLRRLPGRCVRAPSLLALLPKASGSEQVRCSPKRLYPAASSPPPLASHPT